ncbi:MAG: sulfatase [Polyangiaceae bacterium]|nr:sulfatase [Polyangiaceae bacterium]
MNDDATVPPAGDVPAAKPPAIEHDPSLAICLGALLAGVVDVVAANVATPLGGPGVRVMHAAWDMALLFALGLVCDGVVFSLDRGVRRRSNKAFWLLLWAVSIFGMWWTLERIFSRQADALLGGRFRALLYPVFVVGSGLGPTLSLAIGRFLAKRPRWFFLGPVAGLAALVANELLYRDDYIEIHTAIVWCSATLAGASVGRRFAAWCATRSERTRRGLVGGAIAACALAVVPTPNAARLALFRSPGGVGAWIFANVAWQLPALDTAPPADLDPRWLAARTGVPDRPPSEERIVHGAPVVVLLTIDAVRADAVLDPAHADELPTLARLMREGVTFDNARSPGSQTAVSLTALFAGKFFSEMRWDRFGEGSSRFEYAVQDPTKRFVSSLSDGGVSTFKVASLTFLRNEFSVAPGFTEEVVVTKGRRHARGKEVVDPLVDRLREIDPDEPFFAFAHMTEPHAPYDRGKVRNGPAWDRYVSEIAAADAHVARVVRALSSSALADRSILIVTSDHGEAFGEHGTREHTKTIYDELLRVPLIVWGKPLEHRTVDQRVSLVDLGPTILDLFGLDTPDWSAGESLVPLLAGKDVKLERPVLAEGRLRRAMFVGDLKVIVDLRRKTIEAYDLAKDPKELRNLYDVDRARVLPALAALRSYFDARSYTADGYEPLYKP